MSTSADYRQDTSDIKLDKLISQIADAYLNEVGWADVLQDLPLLEQAEPRFANNKQFTGEEWVACHFMSELREKMEEHALAEGRCPSCGEELQYREIKQSRDSPRYEWRECVICREEYPIKG